LPKKKLVRPITEDSFDPTVFIFGMKVGHDHKMTPIDFEVTEGPGHRGID
jgi:hypothetical protein